jgi:hypothetical protein
LNKEKIMNSKFSIYLRFSDASHKLGGTGDLSNTIYKDLTKEKIFNNFRNVFGVDNLTVMTDNCQPSTVEWFRSLGVKNIEITALGDRESFKNMVNLAIKNSTDDSDIVYLVEDDYLHFPDSEKYLREGVAFGGYASLFDSMDKYKNSNEGGYNPFIADGGEITRVILSKSTHWKYTNAVCNTFGTTIKVLKEDYDTIIKYCSDPYPHPMDFLMFCDLWQNKHRLLVNCIPGRSGHVGLEMSPFVDWEGLVKELG